MFGLIARLLGGAVEPLVDKVAAASASLLRKLALFAVAGICLVVVFVALTLAFALWVSAKQGPVVGSLAVAGVYLVGAAVALFLALRKGSKTSEARTQRSDRGPVADEPGPALGEQVDAFTAPLLRVLQSLGLRREQFAVLAGASVAKQIGPLPLVGLAILAGFIIGRMGSQIREFVTIDALAALFKSFGGGREPQDPHEEDKAAA